MCRDVSGKEYTFTHDRRQKQRIPGLGSYVWYAATRQQGFMLHKTLNCEQWDKYPGYYR